MDKVAGEVAVEVVKQARPDLVLQTMIFISIAVTVVTIALLINKYYKPVADKMALKKLAITEKDLEFYKKLTCNISDGVVDMANSMVEVKQENKEIKDEMIKISSNNSETAKALVEVVTILNVHTQMLNRRD